MKAFASILFLLALVTGCARHTASEPSAAPALKDRASCEAAGGTWVPLFRRCNMG
jgi:hypothetical protein